MYIVHLQLYIWEMQGFKITVKLHLFSGLFNFFSVLTILLEFDGNPFNSLPFAVILWFTETGICRPSHIDLLYTVPPTAHCGLFLSSLLCFGCFCLRSIFKHHLSGSFVSLPVCQRCRVTFIWIKSLPSPSVFCCFLSDIGTRCGTLWSPSLIPWNPSSACYSSSSSSLWSSRYWACSSLEDSE